MRLVLASASPARLATLRAAGVEPLVRVSGVDESTVPHADPTELALALADLKAEAVLAALASGSAEGVGEDAFVLVGCDSVLELDGRAHGKPGTDDAVRARWRALRGRSGRLVTGHHVAVVRGDAVAHRSRAASTTVHFADVTDAEIEAYVATGEPQHVAGAFTIDGYGAAFVSGVAGDHHNVVGISVPLLRVLLAELGVAWTDLWRAQR
ncbi:Maf family protein [Propioniciclava soli]|uniref:Nucleoside triphosphate pyrophosphatase n=1 Tax=Propioniciclava soli TaxID=2775081 RepID=A0ABZ3C4G0_9ACTN